MRQYLFSGAIISSIATGLGLLQKTIRSRFSGYLALLWLSWLISLVLAVMAIRDSERR